MNWVLVGNNDGPLTLLKSLQSDSPRPVLLGLQKAVNPELEREYRNTIAPGKLLVGLNDQELYARLAPLKPDLIINCFCNFKFKRLLNLAPVLNVHLAPLPRYRGRHPLHWALINGESRYGLAIHRMSEEIDAGAIYWQADVGITPGMSVQELRGRLMEQLAQHFGKFFSEYLRGQLSPLPNPASEASYVARRFPEDSQLTEWHDVTLIYRKVMALRSEANPAYIQLEEQQIPVLEAELLERTYVGIGRAFIYQLLPNGIAVATTDGHTVALKGFNPPNYPLNLNQRLD